MSGEGTGFVFRHSPYKGSRLIVHLAIGDVVNDAHDNEFWMSVTKLATKCRLGRSAVIAALAELVADDFLEVLSEGGGRGRVTRYRFLMPETARSVDGLETARFTPETARSESETARSTKTTPITRTKETKENGNADAMFVAKSVFDAKEPKPAQPFVAVVKIAQRLLDAGHDRDAIVSAMLEVPTISVGWVEAKLNGRTNGKPDKQTMIDRRFGFTTGATN